MATKMDTVANITRNWRLLVNWSRPKVQNANSGRDETPTRRQ